MLQRFLLTCITLTSTISFGQDKLDTLIQQDTTKHSVKKAALFSAIIPGAGQIYNHMAMPKGKKKGLWKVPLIYAGLGVTSFYLLKNNNLQRDLRSEYESRIAGNGISDQFSEYDNDGLLTLYTTSRQRRDLFILGTGIIYLLNVVDAGVEAHFVDFDISEDLSLSVRPTLFSSRNNVGLGMTATFHFW